MKVYQYDGLICTEIKIIYNNKEKVIDNVVIDTGAVPRNE